MKFNTVSTLLAAASLYSSLATAAPTVSRASSASDISKASAPLRPRASGCANSATSRQCWGDYDLDTDWYSVIPDTGVTREFWLTVENTTMSPDGYERQVLSFNGTVPGPTIIADWGDNLIIHVTNKLQTNGTSIHWHGIRQLQSTEMDGVPGVTQCPIAPGDTMTYKFQATQYGSSWYHSHFILQYAEGVAGGLIINGPASANYDEDLGMLFLSDWSHRPVQSLWDTAKLGGPPTLETGLINGTNTFDCTSVTDAACVGGGKKYETTVAAGKKYRIRLINSAVDGHFQFSIDGHNLTVIGMDLVPIVPYTTDSIVVSMAQRYDVIVEATQTSGDFWIRADWITACSSNQNTDGITGILRYDSSSTADPTTTSTVTASTNCGDEPIESLVPYLAMNVGNITAEDITTEELGFAFSSYFTWTINSSSLYLNWSDPTTLKVFNEENLWPTDYNVKPVSLTTGDAEWEIIVIQDKTGFGITHPIHLHGHDFWVIAQDTGTFEYGTSAVNLVNPPRRDVASLPGNGYLVMAFKKDNPGSWLLHCHIAWHASEGLAMQFVERESEIAVSLTNEASFKDTCSTWDTYAAGEIYAQFPQDDSGI